MKLPALLIAFLIAACGAKAAGTAVLYETGWEPTPASPGWSAGAVSPQNSWLTAGDNTSALRHRVLANGSADANPFGTPVTTPTGSQFFRFTASSSTTVVNGQYSWVDLSAAFTARPAGYDRLIGSMDMFVPSGDSSDASVFGMFAFGDFNFLDYGVLIVPNTRSIMMVTNGVNAGKVSGFFAYNTWFNVAIQADYVTGGLVVLFNGTEITSLSTTNDVFVERSFTDLDLVCFNVTASPNPRVVFGDNYRVSVSQVSVPAPRLTITPGAIGEWHLSWSADYADWSLESTQDITSTSWTNEGVTPEVTGGVASVDLPEAPPRTFYRLRQP